VNFIDVCDVAEVARVALLEKIEPTSQRAYHLSGPRAWTMSQVAEELARLLGHAVTYVDRSPAEQREALLGAGLSPLVADVLVGLDQMFRESVIAETTSTVEELTGEAPRSLTEWLTDNLDAFRA
jgi:NAD(P)H dehydrogenase (quinone)